MPCAIAVCVQRSCLSFELFAFHYNRVYSLYSICAQLDNKQSNFQVVAPVICTHRHRVHRCHWGCTKSNATIPRVHLIQCDYLWLLILHFLFALIYFILSDFVSSFFLFLTSSTFKCVESSRRTTIRLQINSSMFIFSILSFVVFKKEKKLSFSLYSGYHTQGYQTDESKTSDNRHCSSETTENECFTN